MLQFNFARSAFYKIITHKIKVVFPSHTNGPRTSHIHRSRRQHRQNLFRTSRFFFAYLARSFAPPRFDRLRTAIFSSREEALGPAQAHNSRIKKKQSTTIYAKANYKDKKKESSYLKTRPFRLRKLPPHRCYPPTRAQPPPNPPPLPLQPRTRTRDPCPCHPEAPRKTRRDRTT